MERDVFKSAVVWGSILILIVLMALSFVGIRSCGLQKKSSADPGCSDNDVRQIACPAGQSGTEFQTCKDKAWTTVNDKNCKANGGGDCKEVVFDRDISPIIETNCSSCHPSFPGLDVAKSKIDQFLARTSLADGDPQRMPKAPNNPLSQTDKDKLKAWKTGGLLPTCPGGDQANNNPFLDLAAIEQAINLDQSKLNTGDQPLTRWLITSHKSNSGASIKQLGVYNNAVDKALNVISSARDIVLAKPIDSTSTIFRVNLRDLKLSGGDWEAIVNTGRDPINFISNTNLGKLIASVAKTNKPWMHIDSFALITNSEFLYYFLARVTDPEANFLKAIGADFDKSQADFSALFVGTASSKIAIHKNRLLVRVDSNNGYLWKTFDTNGTEGAAGNLFQFPLLKSPSGNANFKFSASEELFSLPNGLIGGALFDAAGKRLNEAALNVVAHNSNPPADPTIKNNISCLRCHSAGLIPAIDEVRSQFDKAAVTHDLRDVDAVDLLYRDPAKQFILDNGAFNVALAKMGISASDPDPINKTVDELVEKDLTAKDVGGLLFLTEAKFIDCISKSAAATQQVGALLTGGTITFAQLKASLPVILRDCKAQDDPLNQGG